MKRLILIVVLLVSMALISSCSAGNEKTISSSAPTPNSTPVENISEKLSALVEKGGSKQELLARLIEKGDRASNDENEGENKRARWAYTFASLFDPENENVAAKLKSLGGRVTEVDSDAKLQGMLTIAAHLSDDNHDKIFAKFPKLTPEMEIVNLRMLLDERLVGDLGYSPWKLGPSSSQLWIFLKKPTINIDEVREAYGKPSIEQTDMSGTKIVTYGLLRILSDKSDEYRVIWTRAST